MARIMKIEGRNRAASYLYHGAREVFELPSNPADFESVREFAAERAGEHWQPGIHASVRIDGEGIVVDDLTIHTATSGRVAYVEITLDRTIGRCVLDAGEAGSEVAFGQVLDAFRRLGPVDPADGPEIVLVAEVAAPTL